MHHGAHINGERTKAKTAALSVALLCLLFYSLAEAGVPAISNQRVTDVTTRSFSVILTASEPSTAVLSLFAADCTTPATGFSTTLQQNATSGNMRITTTGLNAATGYCYQLALTSTATSQLTTTAAAPVTTTTAILRTATSGPDIVPGGNDILKVPAVYLPSGETRSAIITTVELLDGTSVAPLSLLLTSTPDSDYFNFNNLFATATGKTQHLAGDERVKLTENHGTGGCVIERYRLLPTASGGTAPRSFVQANTSDIDASGGVSILDILRVVGGKGTANSGSCFNSDLDLNNDGTIGIEDLNLIKGGFNGLP